MTNLEINDLYVQNANDAKIHVGAAICIISVLTQNPFAHGAMVDAPIGMGVL